MRPIESRRFTRLLLGVDSRTVKTILTPFSAGLGAARHVAWYLSYQLTGEARASDQ
jgi:hypothetical protein